MHVSVCDLNLHTYKYTVVFQRYHDSSVCVRVNVCVASELCM